VPKGTKSEDDMDALFAIN